MISQTIYKTPEGKEIRISVDHTKNKIQGIEVTGEFSLEPEGALAKVEQELKDIDIEEKMIKEKLASIIKRYKITFIGINEKSLVRAILIACGITGPVI